VAFGMLAEACAYAGQVDEGLRAVTEALERAQQSGSARWKRSCIGSRGAAFACGRRVQNAALTAEECFHQALAVARRQQAKSFELRTALS